jgi:hypothetical protein
MWLDESQAHCAAICAGIAAPAQDTTFRIAQDDLTAPKKSSPMPGDQFYSVPHSG